jgi:hypothetical protein
MYQQNNRFSGVVSPLGKRFVFITFPTTTLWEKEDGRGGQTGCGDNNMIRVIFIERQVQVHG